MSKFVANSGKSYISTIHVNQEASEQDWNAYQITEKSKSPIQILSGTDASVLKVPPIYTFDPTGNGGLVAFYPLDGNVNDIIGNYNGIWNGTEQYDVGKFGQAAKFDGSSDITLPDQLLANYIPTASNLERSLTLSLWVKSSTSELESINSTNHVLLFRKNTYINIIFGGTLESNFPTGKLSLYTYGGSGYHNSWIQSSDRYDDNNWHHVVAVLQYNQSSDDRTRMLFIDNVLIGQDTVDKFLADVNLAFSITYTGTGYSYVGKIDQFRIYNRALTQEEITKLYNEDIQVIKAKETILLWNSTDGVKQLEVNSITDNGDGTYDIDISSAGLTQAPTKAHIITTVQDLNIDTTNTTNTSLVIKQFPNEEPPRKDGKLIVYNSNDGVKDKVLSSYSKNYVSLVSNVDPFGDNSGVALWQFEGNANDTGGNYNGTWTNNEGYDTGVFGQAAKFTGASNQGIDFPEIDISSKQFTISAWVKRDSSGTAAGVGIVQQNSNNWQNSLQVRPANGYIDIGNIDGAYQIDENWHHLVVCYNVTYCDLYVDGVKVVTNGAVGSYWDPLYSIGNRRQYDSSYIWKGLIDQVRIFNRPLTDQEIQVLYREELQKYTIDISDLSLTQAPTKSYIILSRTEISLHANENKANVENIELEVIQDLSTTSELHCIPKNITILKDTKKNILASRGILEIEGSDVSVTPSFISTVNNVDPFGDGSGVALYQLDGNANDTGGNYNGTEYGGLTYTAGKFGQCAQFDGVDDYIDTNFTLPAWTQYSFGVWIKRNGVPTGFEFILGDATDGANKNSRVYMAFNQSKFYANMGDNTNYWYDYSTVDVSELFDNNWHYIVLVVNGTSQKLYIDSNFKYEYSSSVSAGTAGNRTYCIGQYGANDYYINGLIDQVRIFNRALTDTEIKQLYYEERFKYILSSALSSIPSSVYVRPDYHQLQTIYDLTYDDVNDIYQVKYNKINLGGNTARSLQAKWRARKSGDENSAIQIDLWR